MYDTLRCFVLASHFEVKRQGICRNCKKYMANANVNIIDNKIVSKKCFSNKSDVISCGKIKPLDEFSLNKYGKYGRHNQCNECRNKNRATINVKRINKGTKKCKGSLCIQINKDGVEKNVNEFNSDKRSIKDGLQSSCKKCRKHDSAKCYSKLDNYVKLLLKNTKHNITKKARQIEFNITHNDVIELYEKQNRCCALSGIKMKHEYKVTTDKKQHIVSKYNISIDRINSKKGYTLDNIQLVCAIINRMKYKFSCQKFIDFCTSVYEQSCNLNHFNEIYLPDELCSNQIKKYISTKYCDMKCNQIKRAKDIEILVTKDDIMKILIEQNGYCALSGNKLTFILGTKSKINQHEISELNMSIDRKDSTKNYIKDNIQLISTSLNYMKSDLTDDEFIELCKIISKYNSTDDKIINRYCNIINDFSIKSAKTYDKYDSIIKHFH